MENSRWMKVVALLLAVTAITSVLRLIASFVN